MQRQLKISDRMTLKSIKSDGILAKLKEMTTTLRLSTIVIALLTLLGASIGLMNIMLVTVTRKNKGNWHQKSTERPEKRVDSVSNGSRDDLFDRWNCRYIYGRGYRLCCDCSCQRQVFHTLELDYTWHHSVYNRWRFVWIILL